MKTLADLSEAIFKQLDRVTDPNLKGEELHEEYTRSDKVATLATAFINASAVSLKAALAAADNLADTQMPSMLGLPAPRGKEVKELE